MGATPLSTPTTMRGKSVSGKDRDRNGERQIDADRHQRQDDEDDGLAVARGPVRRFRLRLRRRESEARSFLSAFVLLGRLLVGFGRLLAGLHDVDLGLVVRGPTPPTVTTCSPGWSAVQRSAPCRARARRSRPSSGARSLSASPPAPMVPPSSPGRIAAAGTSDGVRESCRRRSRRARRLPASAARPDCPPAPRPAPWCCWDRRPGSPPSPCRALPRSYPVWRHGGRRCRP